MYIYIRPQQPCILWMSWSSAISVSHFAVGSCIPAWPDKNCPPRLSWVVRVGLQLSAEMLVSSLSHAGVSLYSLCPAGLGGSVMSDISVAILDLQVYIHQFLGLTGSGFHHAVLLYCFHANGVVLLPDPCLTLAAGLPLHTKWSMVCDCSLPVAFAAGDLNLHQFPSTCSRWPTFFSQIFLK